MRKTQKSLSLAPLPENILLTQPPPYLIPMVRLYFLLHVPFPQLLLLPCLHHLPQVLLKVFPLHLFISLFFLPWIPTQFSFLNPLLNSFLSLFILASVERPSSFFILHSDYIFTQFFVPSLSYL